MAEYHVNINTRICIEDIFDYNVNTLIDEIGSGGRLSFVSLYYAIKKEETLCRLRYHIVQGRIAQEAIVRGNHLGRNFLAAIVREYCPGGIVLIPVRRSVVGRRCVSSTIVF